MNLRGRKFGFIYRPLRPGMVLWQLFALHPIFENLQIWLICRHSHFRVVLLLVVHQWSKAFENRKLSGLRMHSRRPGNIMKPISLALFMQRPGPFYLTTLPISVLWVYAELELEWLRDLSFCMLLASPLSMLLLFVLRKFINPGWRPKHVTECKYGAIPWLLRRHGSMLLDPVDGVKIDLTIQNNKGEVNHQNKRNYVRYIWGGILVYQNGTNLNKEYFSPHFS